MGNPWDIPAANPDLAPIATLLPADQERVIDALRAAIDSLAGPDRDRHDQLQRLGVRVGGRLLRHRVSGEVFVDVDFPHFDRGWVESRFDRTKLTEAERHLFGNSTLYVEAASSGNLNDNLAVASYRRPVPIRAALELLYSLDSPEAELGRRRVLIAERVAAETKAADEARRKHDEEVEQQRRYLRRNKEQLEWFSGVSPVLQVLAVVAQGIPDLQPIVKAAMKTEKQRILALPKWMEAPGITE